MHFYTVVLAGFWFELSLPLSKDGFFLCMPQPSMEPLEPSGPDAGAQEVNPVYLQQLRELDIPEEAAKQVRTRG